MPTEPNKSELLHHEASPAGHSLHILLIEDDDQMRSMLAQSLRQQNYQVTECPDAYHWMNFCAGERVNDPATDYDLVISDIRMPGISGLEVLEGLQFTHHTPPTILITAFGDERTHRRAKALGACAVLDKPFAIQDLMQLIREHCGPAEPREDDRADAPDDTQSHETDDPGVDPFSR